MKTAESIVNPFAKGIAFIVRQPRDWKVTATRASIYRFFYQMVLPYLSVYILALGASGYQLGIANSVGMGLAGLLGPLTGSLIDRFGNKALYLTGIVLCAISYLIFGIAQSWPIIILAMLAHWVGFSTSTHNCSVICANSLSNEDRATAMSVCETLTAGLLGMVGPMVGAFLVTRFGGVNVSGIRPLFFICLAGTTITFFLVLTQLSNQKQVFSGKHGAGFFKGLSQIFERGHGNARFLVISALSFLPQGMIIPFSQAFASEMKGADSYTLGAMVTGYAITPFLLGIPIGRLADRIGRKRVIYCLGPLIWASSIVLVWAPSDLFLIVSGVLQGFIFVNLIITMAMVFEAAPQEYMGRWLGIVRLSRLILGAVSAYLAGAIWDHISPAHLFIIFIGIDLFIRIPLLMSVPEGIKFKNTPE
jgi:MFS family permease